MISANDVDEFRNLVDKIESETKGKTKWIKTKPLLRIAFWERFLSSSVPTGTLAVASYQDKTEYFEKTVDAISRSLVTFRSTDRQVVLVIDGLPKSKFHKVGASVRSRGISVRKVRGGRDEGEILLRLADMTAGLARGAKEGNEIYQKLYQRLKDNEILREI